MQLNVTTFRSRQPCSTYGNSRIITDADINGSAHLYCTPYPYFSLKSSQLPSLASVTPNSPPFWTPSTRKLPNLENRLIFHKTLCIPPPLVHQGVQVYHTQRKGDLLAQQFERSHHLTLHLRTPHHSATITRFVDKFFRSTTPHAPPYNLRTSMKSNAKYSLSNFGRRLATMESPPDAT